MIWKIATHAIGNSSTTRLEQPSQSQNQASSSVYLDPTDRPQLEEKFFALFILVNSFGLSTARDCHGFNGEWRSSCGSVAKFTPKYKSKSTSRHMKSRHYNTEQRISNSTLTPRTLFAWAEVSPAQISANPWPFPNLIWASLPSRWVSYITIPSSQHWAMAKEPGVASKILKCPIAGMSKELIGKQNPPLDIDHQLTVHVISQPQWQDKKFNVFFSNIPQPEDSYFLLGHRRGQGTRGISAVVPSPFSILLTSYLPNRRSCLLVRTQSLEETHCGQNWNTVLSYCKFSHKPTVRGEVTNSYQLVRINKSGSQIPDVYKWLSKQSLIILILAAPSLLHWSAIALVAAKISCRPPVRCYCKLWSPWLFWVSAIECEMGLEWSRRAFKLPRQI